MTVLYEIRLTPYVSYSSMRLDDLVHGSREAVGVFATKLEHSGVDHHHRPG